ncbi:hypothetical protein BROSI_A1195 [Candidatus Brocadia sinica JPN1]|uniref:Uncharacterized protein n=1 Tax=Candidatus Brocadia sinica JPN1 TaxID=1197129 RepID=A0ABQ0JVD0_9BACT|nr:hypothetical protein BROSI_A1195 [Candidatus Brocadia sinica JPN1]
MLNIPAALFTEYSIQLNKKFRFIRKKVEDRKI